MCRNRPCCIQCMMLNNFNSHHSGPELETEWKKVVIWTFECHMAKACAYLCCQCFNIDDFGELGKWNVVSAANGRRRWPRQPHPSVGRLRLRSDATRAGDQVLRAGRMAWEVWTPAACVCRERLAPVTCELMQHVFLSYCQHCEAGELQHHSITMTTTSCMPPCFDQGPLELVQPRAGSEKKCWSSSFVPSLVSHACPMGPCPRIDPARKCGGSTVSSQQIWAEPCRQTVFDAFLAPQCGEQSCIHCDRYWSCNILVWYFTEMKCWYGLEPHCSTSSPSPAFCLSDRETNASEAGCREAERQSHVGLVFCAFWHLFLG